MTLVLDSSPPQILAGQNDKFYLASLTDLSPALRCLACAKRPIIKRAVNNMLLTAKAKGKYRTISMAPINEVTAINAGLNKIINRPLTTIPLAIKNSHHHWPVCQPNILHKLRKIYPPAIKPLNATANFCKNIARINPNNPKINGITKTFQSAWPKSMVPDIKKPNKKPMLAINSQKILLPASKKIAPNIMFIYTRAQVHKIRGF